MKAQRIQQVMVPLKDLARQVLREGTLSDSLPVAVAAFQGMHVSFDQS